MSFSLSFVVAIASNVLVPIRSLLPSPPSLFIPLYCYFLPTLWHQNLLRQATANAVPSRATPASLPACPPARLPVCVCGVCACWHAADTVTFTVLPNVFVACLFVRPAACPLPPSVCPLPFPPSSYFPFRFVLCPFSCRPTAAAFHSMHPTLFVWPQ